MKHSILFTFGGFVYYALEILWRGYSHWSMILVGGTCFMLCGLLNEVFSWDMLIWKQMLICSLNITFLEFAAGCVLNIWLRFNVWDYTDLPLNLFGQICLPYTLLWYALSLAAIVLDDYLRYWFFGEEKPHYRWR